MIPPMSVMIHINTRFICRRQTHNIKLNREKYREKLHLGKVDPSAAAMIEHHTTTDANTNAMSWLVKAKHFYISRLREKTEHFLFGLLQLQ